MVSYFTVRVWYVGGLIIYGSAAEIESTNYRSQPICCIYLVFKPSTSVFASLSTGGLHLSSRVLCAFEGACCATR